MSRKIGNILDESLNVNFIACISLNNKMDNSQTAQFPLHFVQGVKCPFNFHLIFLFKCFTASNKSIDRSLRDVAVISNDQFFKSCHINNIIISPLSCSEFIQNNLWYIEVRHRGNIQDNSLAWHLWFDPTLDVSQSYSEVTAAAESTQWTNLIWR